MKIARQNFPSSQSEVPGEFHTRHFENLRIGAIDNRHDLSPLWIQLTTSLSSSKLTICRNFSLVKKIDVLTYPPLEDHIGVRLWTLSELWKEQFDAEMVAAGHSYFNEACSNVLRYIGPNGVSQSNIVKCMGLSKQAVQQLIDDLVTYGVVKREADRMDRRGKLVVLTQKGLSALHDANRTKKNIERSFEKLIGADKLQLLSEMLDYLASKLPAARQPSKSERK
jgi:DNA-binding MarR family transcriptional regulator